MLTLLDVNPTGHFSFGIHKTIRLDGLGVTLLEGLNHDRGGSANGAGKTSLSNTICTILFDDNPTGYTGESVVNESIGKSFGKVTFLDSNGTKWRVITTRKWRKTDKYPCDDVQNDPSEWHSHKERYSGTDVYLEKWDGSSWKDERATNVVAGVTRLDLKATRKKIIQVVGMSYEQFMNVAYLAQQQSLKFVNGTHKQKLEVISELCDIGVWDRRQAKVKERIKQTDSEIDRAQSTLDGARRAGGILRKPEDGEKDAINVRIGELQRMVGLCDVQIKAIDVSYANWVQAQADLASKIATVKKDTRELLNVKKQTEDRMSALGAKFVNDCASIRHRPHGADVVDMQNEVRTLRGQIQTRRFDLEQLLTGSGKCPRCRTNVSDDHLIRQRELLTMEIKETEHKVKLLNEKIESSLEEWEQQLQDDLNSVEASFKSARSEIETEINFINVGLDGLSTKLAQLQSDAQATGQDPRITIGAISNERMALLSQISSEQRRIGEWDRNYDNWAKYNKMVDDARADVDRLSEDLKYLRAIERAFGDKGIKAHKLSVVLSMLNKAVQEFADILTDGSVKVFVTPFREKTDGSMSTDMQIIVREGEKKETPFGLYSGGEKQQIVLAFIGAFWQVATTQGSGVNILLLDEIFGPLDELNATGVFRYLDHMKSHGKSTILIVTHDKNIKHQLNFDRKWLAEKSNHISQLITDVA